MNKLIKSSKFQQEYCCTVVRIGELHPIENSNYLATTLVNRIQIVVRKDEVKTGDIMIYAANETQLNLEFLSCNNLFELGERHLNKNYQDVQALLDAGDIDGAKSMVGFFNKRGRVKCIRLRKEPSFGFLFGKEALVKWKPELKDINLEEYIGQDFDCVNDELFVKVYVPFVPEENIKKPKEPKDERWSDEVLEKKMKVDPRLGMEERETLCNNKKVPREGIVLRIDDDPMKEAFKLKCVKFLEREKKLMDEGEVDTEMIEGYTENNEGEEA